MTLPPLPPLRDSLLWRMGLLLGGIALLALIGMSNALLTAVASAGDAAAINIAGSLRMQSYRIATRLGAAAGPAAVRDELDEFERRFTHPQLLHAIPADAGDARRLDYSALATQWHERLRPLALELGSGTARPERLRTALAEIDDFVAGIDGFVGRLETHAEAKLTALRWVQGAILLATLLLAVLAWRSVRLRLLPPLRELLGLADRVRRGDFIGRAEHVGRDELGVLAQAFNAMAEDLSKMYADLESRVEAQTHALRRSNRSLELLYATTRRLNEAPPTAATLTAVLAEVERYTGARGSSLCLVDAQSLKLQQKISTHPDFPERCRKPDCGSCVGDGSSSEPAHLPQTLSVPVQELGEYYGVLLLEAPGIGVDDATQVQLLETVARHIASTLRATRQEVSKRRLALLEERNVIARELHDSLAQQLSYLKIQVSRLQSALPDGQPAAVGEILAELREGLSSAYRELRELLTTFRITMAEDGLQPALERALREFGTRGNLATVLDDRLNGHPLSPHQEIHVLQIVREALSNIVHHARARTARVTLAHVDGRMQVTIEDDGVGLSDNPERERHYGLTIMRERTRSLHGELQLGRSTHGGTRVALDFPATHADPPTDTSAEESLHV